MLTANAGMISILLDFGSSAVNHLSLRDFPGNLNIGYTMKQRGIRDLDHCGNRLFRHPERIAQERLIRFSR